MTQKTIEATHVTKTMLPIFILNWILGLGVIQYPVGKPRPAISLIYSTYCLIIYYSLTVVAYPYLFSTQFIYKHTQLPILLWFYSNLILTVGMMRLSWHGWKGMQNYALQTATVENLMRQIGIRLNYDKISKEHKTEIVLNIVLTVILVFINAFLMMAWDTSVFVRILMSVIYVYPIAMVNVSDLTFISYVSFATYRFRQLNKFLESALTSDVELTMTSCPTKVAGVCKIQKIRVNGLYNIQKDYPDFMMLAKEIHFHLIVICQQTDRIYAANILLSIAVTFIQITANAYLMYMSIFTDIRSTADLEREIPFSIMWTCYFLTKIFLLSFHSNKCEQEAILSGDLINKMYDEPWITTETQNEIRDFNMQMIQSPLQFSANGYVTLDLSLVQVMIHTITTYIVIMIQLGQVYNRASCNQKMLTNTQ